MSAPTATTAADRARAVRHVWGQHLDPRDLEALKAMTAHAHDVDGVPVYAGGNAPLADALARTAGLRLSTARGNVAAILRRLTAAEAISPSPGPRDRREFALNLTPGRAWLATSTAPGATWGEVRSSTMTAAETALAEALALAEHTAHRAAHAPPHQAARARLTARHFRRRAEALRGPASAARAHLEALLEHESPTT
ncbi:hypothetical protein [Micrococcus luteus]|uniref:hypothetical protein n=1 Tax=Micrococcus luteus TaxID=1270 RepID=UPI00380C859A